ncbi:MAG: lysophospholipase [Lachnospiraceae bacterium]|nr:lysophospholipase [Lachnospiraceae bacterium]
MKKEEFFYDSRDGVDRIHAVRYLPDEGRPVGILQIVHGMSEYFERYEATAKYFTDRGIVVVGEDHLGHGKSIPEGGRPGYMCRQDAATVIIRDVHRLKKITQEIYPGVPYVILGHSMGSFIVRNYISKYGSGIDGAVLSGTGNVSGGTIGMLKVLAAVQRLIFGDRHVAKMIEKMSFAGYNKKIDNLRTPVDWLSVSSENVDRYIADPLCGFTFTINGYRALAELILRMYDQKGLASIPKDLKIYMISGGQDPIGEYGEGVKRAKQMLEEAGVGDVRLQLYPDDRHEIFNEDDADKVREDLYEWLKGNILKE